MKNLYFVEKISAEKRDQLSPVLGTGLAEDVFQVELDGGQGELQLLGDLLVGKALKHEPGNGHLLGGEVILCGFIRKNVDEPGQDLIVHKLFSVHSSLYRPDDY